MENSLVFDLILLEADRVIAHRMKNFDLYYKDINGSFEKIGDAYASEADDMVEQETEKDAEEFLNVATAANIKPVIKPFILEDANEALFELKSGKFPGSKILKIS